MVPSAAAGDRKMPLEVPPPRSSRFESPLLLSRRALGQARADRRGQNLARTDDNILCRVVMKV